MPKTNPNGISFNIQQGYNVFTISDFGNILLKPGDMLNLNQAGSGKVACDKTATNPNLISDFWIDGSTFNVKNKLSADGNKINFYLSWTVSPIKNISTFHTYSQEGIYLPSITVNNKNSLIGDIISQSAGTISIENPIMGLTPMTNFCQLNQVCILEISLTTGTLPTFTCECILNKSFIRN